MLSRRSNLSHRRHRRWWRDKRRVDHCHLRPSHRFIVTKNALGDALRGVALSSVEEEQAKEEQEDEWDDDCRRMRGQPWRS